MKEEFKQIEKTISGKKGNIYETFYLLMKRTSLTYSEILAMPIPMFVKMVKVLKKDMKEEEKAYKKGKKW